MHQRQGVRWHGGGGEAVGNDDGEIDGAWLLAQRGDTCFVQPPAEIGALQIDQPVACLAVNDNDIQSKLFAAARHQVADIERLMNRITSECMRNVEIQ